MDFIKAMHNACSGVYEQQYDFDNMKDNAIFIYHVWLKCKENLRQEFVRICIDGEL